MYDVIIIGAGHAGCEAALAAARMGCQTLLLTMNLDTIALMPCNPSIGGPAKGHLVREIDALGGEMGCNIDKTFIQIRMLNTGKGPAVQALRAQGDKRLYSLTMKHTLERQPNLQLKQAEVKDITPIYLRPNGDAPTVDHFDLLTATGRTYQTRTVVLTTGTALQGRLITGEAIRPGARAGEPPAVGLSAALQRLGFPLGRLKTGTPPRVDARTIDFAQAELQPGSPSPLYFSFTPPNESRLRFPEPNPYYPPGPSTTWRRQLPCYLVHTSPAFHDIIRANLHRAPMFNGTIQAKGPRYCPSIEDKIVRFADKESHGFFLEPEGWETSEVYVQGCNTSLPEDVQWDMLRTIPALRNVELMRIGYAVEYDFVPPSCTQASLESKLVPGLFFAGQINGTTGYEEAAGQGILAGINAALRVRGRPPLILRRDQGYLGVMVDDLITRELTEPYRLFTSRAEYRLLLRHDNADLRLTPIAYDLGLVDRDRYEQVERKREHIQWTLSKLGNTLLNPTAKVEATLASLGMQPLGHQVTALEFLRRQGVGYKALLGLASGLPDLAPDAEEQVEIEAKYQGYILAQQKEVERVRRLEERRIPQGLRYEAMTGLRKEAQQKLAHFQPATLGQASRISGVTPADVAILMVHLERARAAKA